MPLVSLTLDTLGELNDGLARGIINSAINRMIEDLEDRGQDEDPRTVIIEITGRTKEKITMLEVKASCKLPKYHAGVTVAEIKMSTDGGRAHPVMKFRGDSPENPSQMTIDDINSEAEE